MNTEKTMSGEDITTNEETPNIPFDELLPYYERLCKEKSERLESLQNRTKELYEERDKAIDQKKELIKENIEWKEKLDRLTKERDKLFGNIEKKKKSTKTFKEKNKDKKGMTEKKPKKE